MLSDQEYNPFSVDAVLQDGKHLFQLLCDSCHAKMGTFITWADTAPATPTSYFYCTDCVESK